MATDRARVITPFGRLNGGIRVEMGSFEAEAPWRLPGVFLEWKARARRGKTGRR